MKKNGICSSIVFGVFLVTCTFSLNASAIEANKTSVQNIVKNKVVIQVSDNDPKKWNLALNNAKNVQEDFGKNNVDVEIVAYGPGLPMIKLDSEVGSRIADAHKAGVIIVACENTMNNQKLSKDDMLPNLSYVKSGVPYLMKKQQEGYSYIRP